MKKFVLVVVALLFAVAFLCIVADAQTTSKRKAVKTGTPNGIFSPAIIAGDLVFTSGQIGIDPKTQQMAEGMEAQLEQVFRNLTAVLEASGSSIDHVVKATVFLADMNDYNKMNELYRAKFKGDPPARSTVQVARLPRDARIEIEVVAVLK
jgi:2-iminobutanoate/2-iminopropanoate deaminase